MWQAEEDGRKALLKDEVGPAVSSGDQGMLADYSADFARLRAVASTKVRALRESAGGASWAEDMRAAERALEAMESNRRQVQVQLKLELSGAATGLRQASHEVVEEERQRRLKLLKEWDQRLQEWAREVASFRGELETAREEHGRRALRLDGREMVDLGPASKSARHAACKSTDLLERGQRQLEEAARQCLETEEISNGVMGDLSTQRDVINNMRNNMRLIGAELSSARQSLTRMLLRAKQNQMATSVICTVLGLALVFWMLCFAGLPLNYTLMIAAATLALMSLYCFVRRRLRARGGG